MADSRIPRRGRSAGYKSISLSLLERTERAELDWEEFDSDQFFTSSDEMIYLLTPKELRVMDYTGAANIRMEWENTADEPFDELWKAANESVLASSLRGGPGMVQNAGERWSRDVLRHELPPEVSRESEPPTRPLPRIDLRPTDRNSPGNDKPGRKRRDPDLEF